MAKSASTTSLTLDEIERRRASGTRTDWHALDRMTEAELESRIARDPDAETGDIDWSTIEVTPAPRKQHLTLRLDQDVVDWFKAQGKGYQGRINAVLRSYMLAKE